MSKLQNFKQHVQKQGGFLLVDSIVAVVVLAIGLVAVGSLYMYGTDYRMRASNRQKAVQIAAERIERLKASEAQDDGISLDDLNDVIEKINKDDASVVLTDSETFTVQMSEATSLYDNTELSGDKGVAIVKTTVTWPKDKNDHSLELYSYMRTTDD